MRNRVLVLTFSFLLLVSVTLFAAGCDKGSDKGPVTVTGSVMIPLEKARIYIYQEGEDIYGPASVISEPTGPNGVFSVSLAPGLYVAVVRKRASNDVAGPVLIGDYRGDPVTFQVNEGQETVSLTLTASVKVANEKAFPALAETDGSQITGKVLDTDGNPVPGVRVHVYDHIQMSERPKYVSEQTGADGGYYVQVRRGGTYYLSARDRFGGPPQLGDLFGRYDEGTIDPSGVVVRKGEETGGIDITVHKVW
jgi:hypothetical protein